MRQRKTRKLDPDTEFFGYVAVEVSLQQGHLDMLNALRERFNKVSHGVSPSLSWFVMQAIEAAYDAEFGGDETITEG